MFRDVTSFTKKTANCKPYFPFTRKYIYICTAYVHIVNWIIFAMRSAHLQAYRESLLHPKSKNVLLNSALYVTEYTIRSLFVVVSHPDTYKSSHTSLLIFSAALRFNVVIFITFCLLDLCNTV
jgi:hypothetical protein